MPTTPKLLMTEFNLNIECPTDLERLAQLASDVVLEDIVKGKVSYLILLTFTADTIRLWQLHNPPDADDVVRAVIAREEPLAIAFVHPMALPPEVEGERGYNIAIEAPAGKFDALVALWGGEGLGGEMMRIYGRHVDGEHKWLGVPPEHAVDMWFEGVVGAMGPTAEA